MGEAPLLPGIHHGVEALGLRRVSVGSQVAVARGRRRGRRGLQQPPSGRCRVGANHWPPSCPRMEPIQRLAVAREKNGGLAVAILRRDTRARLKRMSQTDRDFFFFWTENLSSHCVSGGGY